MITIQRGDRLVFTKSLGGVCKIAEGDKAIYLGNSQVKVLDGVSKGWLLNLCIDAPVKKEPRDGI